MNGKDIFIERDTATASKLMKPLEVAPASNGSSSAQPSFLPTIVVPLTPHPCWEYVIATIEDHPSIL